MKIELTPIEQEIVDCLKQMTLDADIENSKGKRWTIKHWTGNIIDRLYVMAKEKGFEPLKEWLYDLVWYKESTEPNFNLEKSVLAMECEWNMDWWEIKYDFEKLLVCNCEIKLMICQTKSDIESIFSKFQTSIDAYQSGRNGERFLIAVYDESDEGDLVYRVLVRK
jgi:hypothetical protein